MGVGSKKNSTQYFLPPQVESSGWAGGGLLTPRVKEGITVK